MSSDGRYQEPLPCGGTLHVTRSSWEIKYYFPGPDLRHKGTFVTVPGSSIDKYIDAFKENWAEFEALSKVIPSTGDFSKPGKMGMSIRIGRFCPGVCLQSYHLPVSSLKRLEEIVKGYENAIQRAKHIQNLLFSV